MNVSESLSDNRLDGMYGLTAKINDALRSAAKEFVYIGFLLDEAECYGYYRDGGFDSIYEYCEKEFGFKRSSTNNFIRVYRCFGEAMGLQSNYSEYSYSQLTEMCSMTPKQLESCRTDMTVKELRELKKENQPIEIKYSVVDDEEPASVQTSGQDEKILGTSYYHVLALEQYLLDRFSRKNPYENFEDFSETLSVSGSGLDFSSQFDTDCDFLSCSVMCAENGFEVFVNKNNCLIPYSVGYWILNALVKKEKKRHACTLKPDIQIPELGKCSNCGELNALENNYCSECGYKIIEILKI